MHQSTLTDPLERDTSEEKHSRNYHLGFHAAELRRVQVNPDITLTNMILQGLFVGLPIAGIYYLVMRGRLKAMRALKSNSKRSANLKKFNESFQDFIDQMRNPTPKRDFKVKNAGECRFKDVIGIPEAVREVREYVDFLHSPERFKRLGAKLPSGCLLTGEPGTGKTLLAKAVAGECNVPFFACSGADFMEVYAGSGPKRVRELFEAARKESPSIIFIDELDAIGARDSHRGGNTAGEENRTINQLLAELDGFGSSSTIKPVVVFAATNYAENLDRALLREGRFDRKIQIEMPDRRAREEQLTFFLRKIVTGDSAGKQISEVNSPVVSNDNIKPNSINSSLARDVAALTPGLSPASLDTIVNEAALAAAVAGASTVLLKDHLRPAIDDVVLGKRQNRSRLSEAALGRVALHEAGHTIVAWMLAEQSDVLRVSIIPRGAAGGYTRQLGREVTELATAFVLFTDVCVMLGGRGGESLVYSSSLSTGANDDLQRATEHVIKQFLSFGMGEGGPGLLTFDPRRFNQGRHTQLHSERQQHIAETHAMTYLKAAESVTQKLLKMHSEKHQKVTQRLLEQKELTHSDLLELLGPRPTSTNREIHSLAESLLATFARQMVTSQTKPSKNRHKVQ